MNPHETLLHEVKNKLENETKWVEVTYKTPFGFGDLTRENLKRKNVSIEDFITKDLRGLVEDFDDIVVFHILLGCGIPRQNVLYAVLKAATFFRRVIVLEHDSSSLDWDTPQKIQEHSITNCMTLEEIFEALSSMNIPTIDIVKVKGFNDNKRNLIVEVAGRDVFSSLLTPKIELPPSFTKKEDVYLGTADPVSNISVLHANIERAVSSRLGESKDLDCLVTCGGFFSFNLLVQLGKMHLKNSSLKFFDVNPNSVEFCKGVIDLISVSNDRKDFMQNYFGLLFDETSARFLPTDRNDRLRLISNRPESSSVFESIHNKILSSPYSTDKLFVSGFSNCGGVGTGFLYSKFDGDSYSYENSMQFGYGWLANEKNYNAVKNLLAASSIDYITCDFSSLDFSNSDLVFSSNILNFLRPKVDPRDFAKKNDIVLVTEGAVYDCD